MKHLVVILLLILVSLTAGRAEEAPGGYVLEIRGAIGPATVDYVSRGIDRAADRGVSLVILRMNTPGGLDNSMRDIIAAILESSVPVVTYVSPSGSRATSAGTYIMYASHIAAMAPATTIGAATPVQMGGMPGSDDEDERPEKDENDENGDTEDADSDEGADEGNGNDAPQPGSAMERKMINDAVSYIRSLAEMRDRNADWAEKAVREAASISSREALELNVIDFIAEDMDELLAQSDGREVKTAVGDITLETDALALEFIEPDWRNELLSVLTNPNVAYILMLVGIYGIIFELANPGAIVPGVLGSISLLLALFAFQALPINYAGLGLMLLGAAFMVGEAFMPSFGILGIGGVVAFILGSLLLLDTGVEAYELSVTVIIGVAAVSFVVIFGIATMAVQSHRRRLASGVQQMKDAEAVAVADFRNGQGKVHVLGELWNAVMDGSGEIRKGERVQVTAVDDLSLRVRPSSARKESQ